MDTTQQVSLDYTKITHQDIVNDFISRVKNDPRFANLSGASIFQMLVEGVAGVIDFSNYYIQRTAEESFVDTAKLSSSLIKLCHNHGYQPRRPIPARAKIAVQLRGPLPPDVKAGDRIWFDNQNIVFTYSKNEFLLDHCYSYTLTDRDIMDGRSATWTKRIEYSVPANKRDGYIPLNGTKSYNTSNLSEVEVIQGTRKIEKIKATNEVSKLGSNYQFYDIKDETFSDYIGERDMFAKDGMKIVKENGICKVGISSNPVNPFETTFAIELVSAFCNPDVKAYNNTTAVPGSPLAVCRIYSNPDKTVRIEFGDGMVVANGMNELNQQLSVQYLSTKGSGANQSGTAESFLQTSAKFFAIGEQSIDVTQNVSFIFRGDVAGGADFESIEKMRMNAHLWNGNSLSLVTAADYRGYLSSLSDPITVKHAAIFSEASVEEEAGIEIHELQNVLFCSVANSLYRNNAPVNIYSDRYADVGYSNLLLYSTKGEYLSHIVDPFIQMMSPKYFDAAQTNSGDYFGQRFGKILTYMKERMEVSSSLYSTPPIIHYFDLVGNIKVNKTYEIESVKREIESTLYPWFESKIDFNTQVYKSDIVKKILENKNIESLSIDLKPSTWLKAEQNKYEFKYGKDATFDLVDDPERGSFIETTNAEIAKLKADIEVVNQEIQPYRDGILNDPGQYKSLAMVLAGLNQTLNARLEELATKKHFNVISLDLQDNLGVNVKSADFYDKNFVIKVNDTAVTVFGNEVYEDGENITVALGSTVDLEISDDDIFEVLVTADDDLCSESAIGAGNIGVGNTYVTNKDLTSAIEEWISSVAVSGVANRAIPLPYELYAISSHGHKETFAKLSNTDFNVSKFYYSMLPFMVNKLGLNMQTDAGRTLMTKIGTELWKLFSASLADSVMDDDNNITEFSMANEIAVIRLSQLKYTY